MPDQGSRGSVLPGTEFLQTGLLPVGWQSCPARDREEPHPSSPAIDHHRDDPAFGYRFIADEINAGPGPVAGERRIWRLCSENGVLSAIHRRRRSGLKIA